MNLIERYVHAVANYLPKNIRDDVLKELRTNIEDMLPENYTEKDVYNILENLGSPLELANDYNPSKRYLIGPGYFDKYIAILKMVVGICIAVSISITILVSVLNSTKINLIEKVVALFTNIITGAIVGTVQGAFWVTLIFIVLERSGVEAGRLPFYNEKWTPDSLPEIPMNDKVNISRGETIFSIISTIIVTALLYLQPQLIAIYRIGENGVVNTTSLLNVNRLKIYIIFIFGLAIFQLGIFVWKYITRRWSKPLILYNTIYNILMSLLVIIMLMDSTLLNPEFLPAISELTKNSINIVTIWFDRGKWIFAVAFIGFCAWDSIASYHKYRVNNSN